MTSSPFAPPVPRWNANTLSASLPDFTSASSGVATWSMLHPLHDRPQIPSNFPIEYASPSPRDRQKSRMPSSA
eukprot:NODE_29444_length_446_cov_0.940439.p3 GENE.NODE_29444_length_446_cov_0.940439~~NODE_29444_length_446_cov_0.940439.p3  ORF type:complete len:73 (+),score=10.61 NODE_29444_length_446_cov_0.940439:105-323(+)